MKLSVKSLVIAAALRPDLRLWNQRVLFGLWYAQASRSNPQASDFYIWPSGS